MDAGLFFHPIFVNKFYGDCKILPMGKYTLILLLSITIGQSVSAQSNKDQAQAKYKQAIALMDEGKPADAIPLLEDAKKLDPDEWSYDYEIAYSDYMLKQYPAAESVLKKLLKRKDINSRVYQLLGNTYDMSGKPEKAIETYEKGLKIFPQAGNLYLERGVMELATKDYNKALYYFEGGIKAAPMFPSNYYWASKIFLSTDEEVWGMIYGEIFLNLERSSKRTDEISKQLYLTYKGEIKFIEDTSVTVSFSKNNVIQLEVNKKTKAEDVAKQIENMKLPFGGMMYEPAMLMAVTGEKIINLASLNRIRTKFLSVYDQLGYQKKAPVVLFDYERKVQEAGFMEPYNYWILAEGDEKQFDEWRSEHKVQWDQFIDWFKKNPLVITEENKFYRGKY